MTNYQTINLQAVAAVVVANWFLFLRYLPANFATTRYLQCLNECSFLAATYTWPLLAKIQNKVPWDILGPPRGAKLKQFQYYSPLSLEF